MGQKSIAQDYTAVLLAAGYGSRILDLTDSPKCLLPLCGETLLQRSFRIWKEIGIKKVHLVLGYQKEKIMAVADKFNSDFEIKYSINEDVKKYGNTYSLYLGIKNSEAPVLIFDADLVYEQNILQDFINDSYSDQILVGPKTSIDDIECAKTLVDDEQFARKTVDKRAISEEELKQYHFVGEAIGILKFSKETTKSLSAMASQFLAKPENQFLNWEHLLNQFLPLARVGIHTTPSEDWIEIDTKSDFEEAQKLFGEYR